MKIFSLPEGVEHANLAMGMRAQVFAAGVDYVPAEGVSEELLEQQGIFAVREEDATPKTVLPEEGTRPFALAVAPKKAKPSTSVK